MAAKQEQYHPFEGLDASTAELILRIQLEEVEEMRLSSKEDSREENDFNFALVQFEEYLNDSLKLLDDDRTTKNDVNTEGTADDLTNQESKEEEDESDDGATAQRVDDTDPASEPHQPKPDVETTTQAKSAARDAPKDIGEALHKCYGQQSTDKVGSSSPAARTGLQTEGDRLDMPECVGCGHHKENAVEVPCGHSFCDECIREIFSVSMQDEACFLPRCCKQPISADSVAVSLGETLRTKFEEKRVEFETPAPSRTYCSQETCSKFIKPANVADDIATCQICSSTTCVICKGGAHDGDCPKDEALQKILETAREKGWQRCYSCKHLVELTHGCHHMICVCGAQFCYSCGKPWKTCTCARWDEDRLVVDANDVVEDEIFD